MKGTKHTMDAKQKMIGKKINAGTHHMQIYLGSAERKKRWQDYANEHFKAESSGRGKVSTMVQRFVDFAIENQIADPSKFVIGVNANEEIIELKKENITLVAENSKMYPKIEDLELELKVANLEAKFKKETEKDSKDIWVLEDKVMSLLQTTKKPMTIAEIIKALNLEKDKQKWIEYEDVVTIENGEEVVHTIEKGGLVDTIYSLLMMRLEQNKLEMHGASKWKWR